MTEVRESSDVVSATFMPAPHGLRVTAWLIDGFVVALLFALLPQPLPILLLLLLLSGYHTILLWLTQQTVGKALVGLKVHRIGAKPGFLWALGRSSFGYFAVDLLGAGILVAFFNRQHQTLHDQVFGSLVTVDQTGRLTAKTLLSRFVAFCQRQAKAVEARKKTASIVGAFWAFLLGLGQTLKNGVEYLMSLVGGRTDRAETSSIVKAMSTKAATMVTAGLTVATGAVLAAVPPARAVAEWLLEPRYFIGGPAVVRSTFDDDAEGWKISGDAQGQSDDPTYDRGALTARDDRQGGTWYWQAPAAFLGNKLEVYEHDLLFRLKVDVSSSPFVESDIVLEGGGLALVYDTPNDPAMEWTSYRIRLDESVPWMNRDTKLRATRDEIRQALADVTRLMIRGEFEEGPDNGWIDDVILGAEPRARITRVEVPESVVSGGPRAPVAVTYSGELRFPVQLIYRPRSCPFGYKCVTSTADFAEPPPDRRLVGEDFAWCNISDPVWRMDWEIVVRDSEHTEIARPAPVVCRQAS